jgi:hypothetical protein
VVKIRFAPRGAIVPDLVPLHEGRQGNDAPDLLRSETTMATITLQSLKCIKQTDDGAGDEDEIYLKLKTDGLDGKLPSDQKYWDMTKGDFREKFTVTEMESDSTSDDVVGEFTFVAEIAPPASPLVFTGYEGEYHLFFQYTP